MLLNKVQSFSPFLYNNSYGFATKSLKLIKIRMKAVESIKKITKDRKSTRLNPVTQ